VSDVGYTPSQASMLRDKINSKVAMIEHDARALAGIITDHGVSVQPIIDEAHVTKRMLVEILDRRTMR